MTAETDISRACFARMPFENRLSYLHLHVSHLPVRRRAEQMTSRFASSSREMLAMVSLGCSSPRRCPRPKTLLSSSTERPFVERIVAVQVEGVLPAPWWPNFCLNE